MPFWSLLTESFHFYAVITIFASRNAIYVKYYHCWWYNFMQCRCKLTLHFLHLYTVLLSHCLHWQYLEVSFARRWLEVSTGMLLPAIPDTRRFWAWQFLLYIPKLYRCHIDRPCKNGAHPFLRSHSHSIICNKLIKKIDFTYIFIVNFEGLWHIYINVLFSDLH